jgi:hypothetical protein
MKQTAVEWLFNQLWNTPKDKLTWFSLLEQAKEMEKEQIIDIVEKSRATGLTAEYLLLTYGSKGSDKYPEIEGTMAICNDIISSQTDHNLPKVQNKDSFGDTSSQTETYGSQNIALQNQSESKVITELSDEEIKPKHKVGKFIVEAIKEKIARTSPQTEISDEEIEKCVGDGMHDFYKGGFIEGAKWYREQLKSRQ